MEGADRELIVALRERLGRQANPERAAAMRAYMKSTMPFAGVGAPEQKRIFRAVFAAYPLPSFEAWRATVLTLAREARVREERYAAIALAEERRYRTYQTLAALPIYEELIVTGAWWDLVDTPAIHLVGGLHQRFPEPMAETLLRWSVADDRWLRRTAILAQLQHPAAIDEALLFACIEPNLGDHDFFIRKAIGWALREYAKTRPAAVRDYVRTHEGTLSPLSRREALKHLDDVSAG